MWGRVMVYNEEGLMDKMLRSRDNNLMYKGGVGGGGALSSKQHGKRSLTLGI